HRANGNRLVVLPAVAGLLARVITDPAGDRRERHVFLDQRVGVEILAALHEVEIALDLLVRAARVVAGRHLVAVHRPDGAPVAGREQILPLFLRRRRRDPAKRYREPIRDVRTLCRHGILFTWLRQRTLASYRRGHSGRGGRMMYGFRSVSSVSSVVERYHALESHHAATG